jgi:hypothetical protein
LTKDEHIIVLNGLVLNGLVLNGLVCIPGAIIICNEEQPGTWNYEPSEGNLSFEEEKRSEARIASS